MRKQDRYNYVLDYLSRTLSDTETELDYSNNFELLVAVVLSAQCTDKRINQITPRLFADYPTPEAMALASPEVLFDYIKTVSYPNNKAKHLQGLAVLVEEQKLLLDCLVIFLLGCRKRKALPLSLLQLMILLNFRLNCSEKVDLMRYSMSVYLAGLNAKRYLRFILLKEGLWT